MKKFLVALVVVSMLGFNTIAFAAEEGQTVDAGVTPDSIFYSADKLFEDLQLLLTTDSEKEAELLLQFAQERLAEAKEMTEEEKTEFVKTAMDAYIETLGQAEEKVTEVAADEDTTQEVKEELSEQLEDTAEVDESIEENLDPEQQEELEEKTTEVSYTASVVKDLDVEVVKTLREAGMGFGNIAHTVALSELSGKSVDEIAAMIEEGKGIGNIAKELGLHPSKMNKSVEVADETDGEEPADEDTSSEEVAEESGENTTDTNNTQQTVSTLTTSQVTSKQVQATSVKAPVKQNEVKASDDNKDKNEKSNENKETIGTQQETSTVTNDTAAKDNKNEVKSTKDNNENGNSGKSNKGSKK